MSNIEKFSKDMGMEGLKTGQMILVTHDAGSNGINRRERWTNACKMKQQTLPFSTFGDDTTITAEEYTPYRSLARRRGRLVTEAACIVGINKFERKIYVKTEEDATKNGTVHIFKAKYPQRRNK